jgi:hypothetical protein
VPKTASKRRKATAPRSKKDKKKPGVTAPSLTFAERMVAAELLPKKGSLATQRLIGKIREDLSLSDAELERIDWTSKTCPTCGVPRPGDSWFSQEKANKLRAKKIELSGLAFKLLVEQLERLHDEKEVEAKHVSLFDKLGVEPDGG